LIGDAPSESPSRNDALVGEHPSSSSPIVSESSVVVTSISDKSHVCGAVTSLKRCPFKGIDLEHRVSAFQSLMKVSKSLDGMGRLLRLLRVADIHSNSQALRDVGLRRVVDETLSSIQDNLLEAAFIRRTSGTIFHSPK